MKVLSTLFKALLYFIFIILLIEGTTRIFFLITSKNIGTYQNFCFERLPKIFIADPLLDYRLAPKVTGNALTSEFRVIYEINSFGLRDKEIRDSDKLKILFLGDSITFGEGVPYGSRFSDLIEKESADLYTINAGVPGYGIRQMYLWLKCYGMGLKPDLVICAIMPIDLDRAIYKKIDSPARPLGARQQKNSENKPGNFPDSFKNISAGLLNKSYFYAVVKVRMMIARMSSDLKKRDRQVWDEINIKGDSGRYKVTTDEQRKMVKDESAKIFLDFKNLCDNKQVDFLVVNIAKEPIPWLSVFFAQHNIGYIDLSDQLKKFSRLTFEIDPHYNTFGHSVIAHLLRGRILDKYKDRITGLNP